MALIKPPVLPTWAESGDQVQPSNAEIQVGWPLSNTPPARQRWNWLLNYLMNGVRYFARRGLPDYDAAETYKIGDVIIGDDGKTYRSLQDANTGNTPSTATAWWERWGYRKSELAAELNNHDYKDSCRVATTANLAALSGLLTVDGVVLVAGNRVLVKDQTTGSQNGIYVAAAGVWSRAADFDENSEVTAGCLVMVTEGSTQPDTLWKLTTDDPITVGVTSLVFANATGTASTPAQFDNSTKVATTAFVKTAQGNLAGLNAYNASATLPLSDIGKLVAYYGSTAAQTLTLPAVATVPAGYGYTLVNQSTKDVTIKGNAAETINYNIAQAGQGNGNTIVMSPGDSIEISSNGADKWNVIGFTSSQQFPNAKTINGYTKLPNGLILQWGIVTTSASATTAVSWPIAFPSNILCVTTACAQGTLVSTTISSQGLTGMNVDGWNQAGGRASFNGVYWMALGY